MENFAEVASARFLATVRVKIVEVAENVVVVGGVWLEKDEVWIFWFDAEDADVVAVSVESEVKTIWSHQIKFLHVTLGVFDLDRDGADVTEEIVEAGFFTAFVDFFNVLFEIVGVFLVALALEFLRIVGHLDDILAEKNFIWRGGFVLSFRYEDFTEEESGGRVVDIGGGTDFSGRFVEIRDEQSSDFSLGGLDDWEDCDVVEERRDQV